VPRPGPSVADMEATPDLASTVDLGSEPDLGFPTVTEPGSVDPASGSADGPTAAPNGSDDGSATPPSDRP